MVVINELKRMLSSQEQTISVVESITAGNMQSMISSVSGASSFFVGGITTYTLESKVKILGVNRSLAEMTNCVDQDIADQMAAGALNLFESSYCIATCGYAEPDKANNIEVPFSYISIINKNSKNEVSYVFQDVLHVTGSREEVQKNVACFAIERLYDYLVSI